MLKGKYIVRSPENVVKEIEYLVKNFNIKSIFFQDWEFTIDKRRTEEICDLLLKKNFKILWGCNARANDIDNGLVKKMKQAGCVRVNIGFESGSQKILDNINKGIRVQDLENAARICRENNINVRMYAMLNLPGENKETIKETVNFFAKNNIDFMAPSLRIRAIPYPGTSLFKRLKAINSRTSFGWDNIEKYAGKIDVEQGPEMARLYYRHFKFKNKFGPLYFLKPGFYGRLLKYVVSKLKKR